MFSKKPSKLLTTATQLLSKCEDLRAEVYEERRLAQFRSKAAVSLWQRGKKAGISVRDNPLARQQSSDAATTPTPRNDNASVSTGAAVSGNCTVPQFLVGTTSLQNAKQPRRLFVLPVLSPPRLAGEYYCSHRLTGRFARGCRQTHDAAGDQDKHRDKQADAARSAEAKLGAVGASEAWDILHTYQAKNGTRCCCQYPPVLDFEQAEMRRKHFTNLPPEKKPPDLELYMTARCVGVAAAAALLHAGGLC